MTVCEYCHEDRDGYVCPIDNNSHVWVNSKAEITVWLGGYLRSYEINYCPMCGRELRKHTTN